MQGQIVRVKGKFNNSNLPKLSDFDTSALLKEILNHSACESFYDLTDATKMTLSDGLILAVQDLKGGNDLVATLARAPTFNLSVFSGRGGAVFNGAQRMTATGIFSGGDCSVLASVQITENSGNGLVFMPLDGIAGGNLYASTAGWKSFSGALAYNPPSMYKRTLVSNIYRVDLKHKQIIDENILINASGASAHLPVPASVLNIGATAVPDLFLKGIIGHIAVFNIDITSDQYLLNLLHEFHKRQYNI